MTYLNKRQGFTLLELIVGIAIFTIVVLSSTVIFQKVVDGQRMAVAAQNTQESLRYAMEHISKEIRMAQVSEGACGLSFDDVFYTPDNNSLKFKNQYGECVTYFTESSRFKIRREKDAVIKEEFITSDDVFVSNLKFYVRAGATEQPAVTLTMRINSTLFGGKDLYKSQMDVQTTVSSRYYYE